MAAAAIIFASSMAPCAQAEEPILPLAAPDPAGITVPNINVPPHRRDKDNYDTYFYFHKDGVTYQRAFADLDECRMFGQAGLLVTTAPSFVPLGNTPIRKDQIDYTDVTLRYGIAGSIIVGIIVSNAMDDNKRGTIRRCMMYKGYARYGTSEDIWDEIDSGTDAEKLARQAIIASGPLPVAGAIAP